MDTTKKIKICLVLPSLEPGGMERVMSELAWYFSKNQQLDIHLVLYGYSRNMFYSMPDNITIHMPHWRFDNSRRSIFAVKTFLFLRKKITSLQPDTILSFGERWNNIVLLSLLGTDLPVYISDRSQPNKNLGLVQNTFRKWLYPKAAGLILQTEKAKEIYFRQFRALKIQVIGNPIRAIDTAMGTHHQENTILMVGRFITGKNQDRLIKIFARINNPQWKLILVGHDLPGKNIMGELKALAVEYGIGDKVVFTGEQQNVNQYYLAGKIFAFTSDSEGFPNAVGEAMSGGMPVVSYDCLAGPSDMIVDSTNGFLIPLYDDVRFEEKLQMLMNNEEMRTRLGKQAKEDIQRFSAEMISKKFYTFITSHC